MNDRTLSCVRKMKRATALLLTLVMLFALAACGIMSSKSAVCEIAKITETTVTSYEDGKEYTKVKEEVIDEQGLVRSVTLYSPDSEKYIEEFSYGFDDHDRLNFIRGNLDGETIWVSIENTYDGDRLTEAVISDIYFYDESFKEKGLLDAEPSGSKRNDNYSNTVFSDVEELIGNYVGYQDCTLRFGDTGYLTRYEDGKIVYDYRIEYSIAVETIYEYARKETTVTTNTYRWQDGRFVLESGTSTVYDEDKQTLRMSVTVRDVDVPIEISFRFEDETDPATGDRIRLAYADGDSLQRYVKQHEKELGDAASDELEDVMDRLEKQPLYRYTLDRKGRVVKIENMLNALASNYVQTNISFIDEQGRVIRREIGYDTGSYRYYSVTETEYR